MNLTTTTQFSYLSEYQSEYCNNFIPTYCFDRILNHSYVYQGFCHERELLQAIKGSFEIPLSAIALVLCLLIIAISIFGNIDGTFKWCVMNIAILHTLWPLFYEFIFQNLFYWIYSPSQRTAQVRMMMNSFLAIGTQGVTTAIASSIPLALNRFLLTYQSRFYKFFFGSGSRIVLTLVCYNFLVFLTFYTLYELSIIGLLIGGNLIPSTTYYIVTITIVVVTNVISLILMLFVLYYIYSSFTLVISLDQTKMLKERKRIAWVIIFQILINFGLSISRVAAFYNVSFNFDKRPALACYSTLLNIYDSFSYVYQELLVCIDCIVYLFILTPYREELAKFLKKRLGCNRVHAIMVSTVSNSFNPQIVVHPRGHPHIT